MKKLEVNLKSKALEFLARREYGYHELYLKLQKYSEDLDEIKHVLDELKQKKFLSEHRYISNYLHSKQVKYGIRKIRYDLLQKKVNIETLDEILEENKTDEYTVAYSIWQRKFGQGPIDNKERMRQVRFLQSRGFSSEIISRIINGKK